MFGDGVAHPGETVDVTGSGFKPGQQVQPLSDGATITTQAILRSTPKAALPVSGDPARVAGGHSPGGGADGEPRLCRDSDFKISPAAVHGRQRLPYRPRTAEPRFVQGAYSACAVTPCT